MYEFRAALFASLILASSTFAQDQPPVSLDPRLKIELFAENPQIVTPTGIDVDHTGRVWAIESNTHFPPEGYKGHPTDRVLVMEDTDGDRKADKITVFKDGLTHTMSIAVKPVWLELSNEQRVLSNEEQNREKNNTQKSPSSSASSLIAHHSSLSVFIATRREILLCTDTDGDLKCDETRQLVHLETKGNYPHNGLAGFAFDALGNMFFGFGENLGADYKIIGSDGTTLSGGGEGGNIYRCKPDGTKLERWATGFWNPHASCFDAFGRLFTLDNDPDSRPPCRLLHIIPGGDYGYRFRNGRKGTHPFTSWNGEIPGTLPMVSGTGEAPSGIVCYESDGFPEDYLGTLLVGSWGDHRIDKFVLKPRGASFESLPQPVIKGGENFRPVGLALAPDGSLYVTDWVLKDYKLHGKGRVWRVSAKESLHAVEHAESQTPNAALVNSKRLESRRVAAQVLASTADGRQTLMKTLATQEVSERARLESLWAIAHVPADVDYLLRNRSRKDALYFEDEVAVAYFGVGGTPQWPNYGGLDFLNTPTPGFSDDDVGRLRQERYLLSVAHKYRFVSELEGGDFMEFAIKKEPFIFNTIIMSASESKTITAELLKALVRKTADKDLSKSQLSRLQLACVLTARKRFPKDTEIAKIGLLCDSPSARQSVTQWVGEENLKELRPEVEKVLASEPMTNDLFMACLASLSMLDGVPPAEFEKAPPVQHILPIVKDTQRSASLRAIALRMLPPTLKELDGKLLGELVASTDEGLRREAVRTLGHSPISERDALLRDIAADESLDVNLRADAVAGLAPVDQRARLNEATRDLLLKLVNGKETSLAIEALRSLRSVATAKPDEAAYDAKVADAVKALDFEMSKREPSESRIPLAEAAAFAAGKRPSPDAARTQYSVLSTEPSPTKPAGDNKPIGDVAAGRRVFFHTNSAGCFKCHTVGGRGGAVGPDLTVIARTMDRQKLAESILEPSKEISPQFTTWAIETKAGKVLTGMLLGEEVNGDLRLGDNTGKVFFVPFNDIETRQPLKTSIMPEKLHEQMTPSEFRDLISFLETLK